MTKLMKYHEARETCMKALEAASISAQRKMAHETLKNLNEKIAKEGAAFEFLFGMYEDARECGNDSIDFYVRIEDKEVKPLMTALRKNGITRFTLSTTCSVTNTAWLIQEAGWRLTGVALVNEPTYDNDTHEYEKVTALVFEI